MIDTHAHMTTRVGGQYQDFEIEAVILSGASIEDSWENMEMAKKNPKIFPAVGVHPQDVGDIDWQVEELEKMLLEHKKIVAVGECGLEFFGEFDAKKQERLFRAQICLADKYKKPLIIHARKAVDEVIDILGEYKVGGVIHCYTGGKKRIQKVLKLPKEWYFGIDGNLTYEMGLEEVVRSIPNDRLLAETDSPELTPLPFRGQKNRPDYVRYVYQKISEIWEMSFDKAEKILDENARQLFKI